MQSILNKYLQKQIGINLDKAFHLQKSVLVAAEADYFSIMSSHDDCLHHFPYSAILQVIENPDGVRIGGFLQHKQMYALVIKVGYIMDCVPI